MPSSIATPAAVLLAPGSLKLSHQKLKQPAVVACKPSFRPLTLYWKDSQELRSSTSAVFADNHLPRTASGFMGPEQANSTYLNFRHRKSLNPPSATEYNDVFKFHYPVIKEKPDLVMRIAACVPYLLALQLSGVGHFILRFSEHHEVFENLMYFVPGMKQVPPWFSAIYCHFSCVGIVKNRDWPHFLRFHLMMGMLLETALQLVWFTGNFFPLIHYNGSFGINFWAGVGLVYILTVLECVRCAIGGMYADHIPFITEAAYVHTLCNVGSN